MTTITTKRITAGTYNVFANGSEIGDLVMSTDNGYVCWTFNETDANGEHTGAGNGESTKREMLACLTAYHNQ